MTGAIELQPDDRPRSSLGIGPGLDDAMGPHQEFARRFAEGIGKFAGNTPGDRQKKTIGLIARMLEAVGLAGNIVEIRFERSSPMNDWNDLEKKTFSLNAEAMNV
ncbi:hypothetical protein B296_00028386 [Ensete ventricosum]|uniref:Uncharacterized protein n=1 Tax=Ensete ventricosum TaxID=4639 RepID=A0A426XJ25_ENSVE|nr:hypothetical protein B296_00028386 [Ensete ventricosum]